MCVLPVVVDWCVLIAVSRVLFAVRCLCMFSVVRWLSCVVVWFVDVVCVLLSVVCCMFVVCCVLFVECCLVFVVG